MEHAQLVQLGEQDGSETSSFPLEAEVTRIGRAEDNDIILRDVCISRSHGKIVHAQGGYWIQNVGGRNPILLNGAEIQEAPLRNGDWIRLGCTDLLFRCDAPATEGKEPLAENYLTIDASNRELLLGRSDGEDLQDLRRARHDLTALYRAGQVINASLSVADLSEKALDTVLAEMSAVDCCSIHLLDADTNELRCQAQKYRHEHPSSAQRIFSRTLLDTVIREMKAVLTFDAQDDGRFGDALSIVSMNMRAAMCVPIQVQGRLTGVLQAYTLDVGHTFTIDDLKLLTALGMLAGVAVQNAMLYEKLASEKAIEAERARTMQIMVHELKSPVAGTRTMAETLRMQMVAPEEQPYFLQRIVARLDNMLEWINDTLSFSRIKTGRDVGEPERLNLCSRVQEIAGDYREQAEAKQLRFAIDTPDQPIHVLMEGKNFRLILSNLVSNAVKYTAAGEVGVTLAEEGGFAVIQVRDSGMGIPEKDLAQLFGEFFRASNARKSKIEGSGVGLASVKHLVDRAGGRVDVESEEKRGTTFTVRLPVAAEE
jgi:signal transduction histidine kinase